MKVDEAQLLLRYIGFGEMVGKPDGIAGPKFKQTLRAFQMGYAFCNLEVDGILGPRTSRAIKYSENLKGACSPNFKFVEFKSRGNGFILVHRELVRGLEELRKIAGPIVIVSGYRDPAWNKRKRGAKYSQHMYGVAADIPYNKKLTLNRVQSLQIFSGIGFKVVDGQKLVRHVDMRHLTPHNRTNGSPKRPSIWKYA